MSVVGTAGYEVQIVAIDALANDMDRALEWARELVLEPSFPEDRTSWLVQQARAELDSLADHPDERTEWAFRSQLYSPHPRGRPLQGSHEGLARLDAGLCSRFHSRSLACVLILTIAGAIDPDAARRRAEELFSPLVESAELDAEPELSPVVSIGSSHGETASRRSLALAPGAQAQLFLGGLTVTRADPLLFPLELLAVILGSGSGLQGRIPYRVREADGLAYNCHATTCQGAGLDPGFAEIYLATAVENVDAAERAVRDELARLAEEGPEQSELEEARSFLLGREPFRRETARQWSALLAEAELYGLPLDQPGWIERNLRTVRVSQVEEIARRFFNPAAVQVTVGRPPES
jgi:zinc protease